MNILQLAPLLVLGVFPACAHNTAKEPAGIRACQSTISAFGSRSALKASPDKVAVMLSHIALTPNAIGYGPGAGYLEELTLVDGVWQIAHATGAHTVSVSNILVENGGAVFLVTASPDAWADRKLETPVNGMNDLEAVISKAATLASCAPGAVPFKLTGTIRGADWSVVGRPSGAKGRIDVAAVTLIGMYDPVEADRYFMPKGRSVHVHILTADGRISGHLDSFVSLEAGTLMLPQ